MRSSVIGSSNRSAAGEFHVLPTNGYAMYAPDVRAISDEARFGIRDLGDGARQARR
jgi:hypothetical protein